MVQREAAIQRGCVRFCKRAVDGWFVIAAHDRGRAHSQFSHLFQKKAGAVKGWPDVEVLVRGLTVRIELKVPGSTLRQEQQAILNDLAANGHPTGWANSVAAFAQVLWFEGVPLKEGWQLVAAHEDQLVAGDIRKLEARAGYVPKIRKRRGRRRSLKMEGDNGLD
jgi:hypothetical protein